MNHSYNISSSIQINVTYQINDVIYEGNFGKVLVGYIKDDRFVNNINKNQDNIIEDSTYYGFKIYDKLKLKKIKFAIYNEYNEIVYINGIEKFKQEALILSKLCHKNIVQYIEFIDDFYNEDSDESISVLVTSYVSNGAIMMTCNYLSPTTMNNYIINSAILPPHGLIYRSISSTCSSLSQITELDLANNCYDINSYWCTLIFGYIIDIAEAVSYMHSKSISHRDIKPENLLLSTNNHIILCDFGSAEDYSSSKSDISSNNNSSTISNNNSSSSSSKSETSSNNNSSRSSYNIISDLVSNTSGTMCFWAPECIAPERFASKECGCDNDCHNNNYNKKNDTTTIRYEYSAFKLDDWSVGIVLYCLIYARVPFFPTSTTSNHSNSNNNTSSNSNSINNNSALELFDAITNTEPSYDLSIDVLFPYQFYNTYTTTNATNNNNYLNDYNTTTTTILSSYKHHQQQPQLYEKAAVNLQQDKLFIILKGLLQKQPELRLSMRDILITYASYNN